MRKRRLIQVMLVCCGVLFSCPLSPVPCPIVGAAELKIGYVDLAKVFDGYERTKVSDAELEKKGSQKEAELQARMNELKKLREGLELLNDQAKDARAREIEQKSDELQRFRTNTARDLKRERDHIAGEILQDIQQTVDSYAKANGYTLIFNEKALLYSQPALDVTDGILKALNSRKGAVKAAP